MHFAIFFNLNFINPRIYHTSGKNLSGIAHHKGTRQNKNSFASKTMKWMAQVWKSETLDMVTYSDLLCPHQGFLEKEMATHSSILVWRIPRTEEPGRLQSMGSQRIRHNWATVTHSSSLWPHPSLPYSWTAFLVERKAFFWLWTHIIVAYTSWISTFLKFFLKPQEVTHDICIAEMRKHAETSIGIKC